MFWNRFFKLSFGDENNDHFAKTFVKENLT